MASKPELIDALKDPARIFNMDETSVEVSFNSLKKNINLLFVKLGTSGKRVLAERNTKVLYSVSSGSREHITASYTVSANGDMVSPRCVFKGVRNIAQNKLKDLPKNGLSGNLLKLFM